MKSLFPKNQLINRLFFVFLGLFLLITLTGKQSSWINTIVSFPLIFLYPGYYISRCWKTKLPAATRFSLSVVFSIALFIILLSISKGFISLTATDLSSVLILVNGGIALIYWQLFSRKQQPDTLPYSKTDLAILFAPFVLFVINFCLSPVISEGDSYYFIDAAKKSFAAGSDVSPYINRPGFIPFIGLLHVAGGETFVFIFRFILSALFYASILMLIDYIKKYSRNYSTNRWLYLLILAAPILTTEVDIARTQSLVFAFTLPVLILLSEFLTERKITYLLVATLLAVVGTRVHELSFTLLLTCTISLGVFGLRYFLEIPNRKLAWKNLLKVIAIGAIVLFPYLKLLSTDPSFAFIRNSSTTIINNIIHPHWVWWFLSNYTVDGNQVGWSGTQAILYYLNNGILLIGGGLLLFLATQKKIRWITTLPAVFFFGIYLSVAEILPRLGFIYYPNRAWPHLMIGFVFVIITLSLNMTWRSTWIKNLTIAVLALCILSGLIGWIRLTTDKGGFFTQKEIPLRNFVETEIPSNATILVAQSSNQAFIGLYTSLRTAYVPYTLQFVPNQPILKTIYTDQIKGVQTSVDPSVPYLKKTVILNQNGNELSETSELLPQSSTPVVTPQPTPYVGPLYFYYSFARFDGYMGSRDWWKDVNSIQNFDFFKNYPNSNVVYRDDSGIIIKLQ